MWPLHFRKLCRQIYKMTGFVTYIFIFITGSWVILFVPMSDWSHRRHLSRWASSMSRRTLKLLNIKIKKHESKATRAAKKINNHFIVSNHLGYLDILAISAETPSCFVTSVEIRETPFLGFLTQMAGCLYVERRNRSNIHNEIRDVTEGLLNGLNVCVFPEATSTNGDEVLRFRQPLYNAAIQSDTDVLPVCLNYTMIDNVPVNIKNRDKLFWYGDMPFLSHLWEVMGHKEIHMRLDFDETISPSDLDCPRLLAARTHLIVSSYFQKPLPC
jgi:1-acyl-sn-glycerol-3-phosphate acyltransferase